jgi:hypothetical protein
MQEYYYTNFGLNVPVKIPTNFFKGLNKNAGSMDLISEAGNRTQISCIEIAQCLFNVQYKRVCAMQRWNIVCRRRISWDFMEVERDRTYIG